MPEKRTMRRARRAKKQGKASTTQAGEFVREEMHHVKSGKHGAKSRAQAIAIGMSKARRSGVKVGRKRGASARNRRRVPGARSTRAPQRSGSRRAPSPTRVSARVTRTPSRRRSTRSRSNK